MDTRPPLEIVVSRHFLAWLDQAGVSLAFTTYQTNRLFLLGLKPDGTLSAFERAFDRPMGLTAAADRLYLSTRWQIWRFDDALPPGGDYNGYDRVYVPRLGHTTGDLDVHDLALDRDNRLVFVNTAYSCLATLSERYSFTPLWQPPFISRLAPEDRCHLNGLAMADGEPAYVTAVSRSDVAAGWRDRRERGGCVVDVEDGEIVTAELSMPHSPRVHDGRLWVLNSGSGELGRVERASGRFEPIAFCPGFLRGLAFCGDYAVVGLSQSRRERTFAGLELDQRLKDKDADARCGLWVVDLRSGTVVHWLQLEGVVVELYDVAVLPGVRRPMALGFQSDEIERIVTIDQGPRPRFEVLTEGSARTRNAGARPAPPGLPPGGLRSAAAAPISAFPTTEPREDPHIAQEAGHAYRLANQHAKEERWADAIAGYEEVLRSDPGHVNALINLGAARHRLGLRTEAADSYHRALALDPRAVRAHTNLALLLYEGGDLAGAIRHYEEAERLDPGDAEAANHLGLALYEHGQLDNAARAFARALELDPTHARAANNLAGVRKVQGDRTAAMELQARAAALDPTSFESQENLGKLYEEEHRIAEARTAYRRALAIRNDPVLALHAELLCPPVFASADALDNYRRHAEDVVATWSGRALRIEVARVQSSRAEPPYEWTYHGRDNLPLKRRYAGLFAEGFQQDGSVHSPRRNGPWHIGFVVTPAHEGVFARCMSGIVNRLDRRRFRLTLVYSRPGEAVLRGAIPPAAAATLHVPLRFDHTVAAIRQAAFDVIYFWEVGTDSTNYFLPFLRLAPVQCTGWGWPDTSGAPALDFHLTSTGLADAATAAAYSERLICVPHLPPYAFRPPPREPPRGRAQLGLPPRGAVYACAQNARKLHPDFDAIVEGILRADPSGTVVCVGDTHPVAGELLRRRWDERLGDLASRVRLLPRLTPEEYFDLLAGADVLLDPLYFGGANSSYDAFAAGVPVVTLPGPLPRGRYTAAMYRCIGVEDTIAGSIADYVDRAVALGTDPTARTRLSARIAAAAPPLFENPAAVTQLEDFFTRACRGEL